MPPEIAPLDDELLENAYYRMLDAAPDALVIADEQGTIRLVNVQAEQLFGYERAELLGAPIEILLPHSLRAAHVAHRTGYSTAPKVRAMGSGLELHGRRKDGTEFPLEVSLSPLVTEAGLFVLSALRDISERKRAEIATLLLAAIVDSSEDAILSTSLEGTITSWNRGAERVFGHRAEQAIGQPFSLLAPRGPTNEEQGAIFARLLAGELVEPYEAVRSHRDGRQLLVSIRVSAIRDSRGALLGFSSTVRDITESRRVEERARLMTQRLLSAVESIQGMFALFDADDRIVVCNSSFREFFGRALPGSLVGRSFAELVDGSLSAELFDTGTLNSTAFRHYWMAQHRGIGTTFELVTRDHRTLRVCDRPTSEGGIVKTIWDISDDVRLADELRRAHLIAESASAAKSEFLASMSHELRTPLNAILGFAQLLQRDRKTPLTDRQFEKVAHIVKGGEHLLRLIDDVLDLARIEAGRVTVSLEPVDVKAVLLEVAGSLEPMAGRAGIALDTESAMLAADHILADRTRFSQVVMNYASNAIKYGRRGGHVRFKVHRPRESWTRISVIDDGNGIPLDQQSKLFEPFQRAGQELGPIEGTGIGLMICKRLANIMGGEVGFQSEPGAGAEFWVELPTYRGNRLNSKKADAPAMQYQELTAKERTIVYVEDNPSNIAFMQDVVEEFPNVRLITATTAEVGIETVRKHRPDVVIMDINLPGMNGIDATKRLHELPETREIPVIALTAAALIRESQKRDTAVFKRYLTKPVRVDELVGALEEILAAPGKPVPASG